MPQGSTTTALNIATGYTNTQFSLGGLVGSLCANGTAAAQQTSMLDMRYTQGGAQQGSKIPPSGNPFAGLGYGLAINSNGNTIAGGAPYFNSYSGAAYVFTRSGTTWSQQASLTGSGGVGQQGAVFQGTAVALSADGNTLASGGTDDEYGVGAAWIFTRSGTTWTQQGSKLAGTGYSGTSYQGYSIALSADGNTLALGGYWDNFQLGATWIFTRSGTTWSQQGSKLVGSGYVGGKIYQATSIALSADGNTLAVGGSYDDGGIGAVWIFTRSGTTWTQQGSKLVGTGITGSYSYQGESVSLSADGNTLAVGGTGDNSSVGATWIFTRSGTTWTQQGSKLVGSGNTGTSYQGRGVSLSADGNVLTVGGYVDNSSTGATWIFTRTNTTWSQQGSKLVGTGATGGANQGWHTALAKNGNTIAVAGPNDNSSVGAIWVFV